MSEKDTRAKARVNGRVSARWRRAKGVSGGPSQSQGRYSVSVRDISAVDNLTALPLMVYRAHLQAVSKVTTHCKHE